MFNVSNSPEKTVTDVVAKLSHTFLFTLCQYAAEYGRRAFFCAGLAAWNSLLDHLKNSTLTIEQFRDFFKIFSRMERIGDFHNYALD